MRPLQIVEACWRAEERKDVPALVELYHQDAVWMSGPTRLEGREAIGAMYSAAASSDVQISIRLCSQFESGDDVAVEWTAKLTRDGSVLTEIDGFNAVRTDGSTILALRAYIDAAHHPEPVPAAETS